MLFLLLVVSNFVVGAGESEIDICAVKDRHEFLDD
jgi:hypothetical protein